MAKSLQEAINYTTYRAIVGSSSTRIVPDNDKRRYLKIVNVSDEVVWIHPQGTRALSGHCLPLAALDAANSPQAAGIAEFSHGLHNMTRQAITATCASGDKAVVVIEGHASGEGVNEPDAGISSSSSSSSNSSSSSTDSSSDSTASSSSSTESSSASSSSSSSSST